MTIPFFYNDKLMDKTITILITNNLLWVLGICLISQDAQNVCAATKVGSVLINDLSYMSC